MALWVFAALLAAQSGHFWRHTAWITFQVYASAPDADGVFVEQPGGRWGLHPRIAAALERRLAPEDLTAVRREAAGPVGGKAAEAGDWLPRVSSVTLVRPTPRFEQRVRVEVTDRALAGRLGRMLADEVIQQSARMRLDAQIADVERLVREVEALGDQAPPELRAKLREMSMGGGMQRAPLRLMDKPYPVLGARRTLVGRRLAEAALPAGLGALLAGAATAGVVAWAGRRRG